MKQKYLEFGIIKNNKKKKLRFLKGIDAYNLWHLGVRFKEKSELLIKLKKKKVKLNEISRIKKFLFNYLLFSISKSNKIL